MMRMFASRTGYGRWLVLAAFVAILSLMLVAALPQTSLAWKGPECHGRDCAGKNPVQMGCSKDAVTLGIVPEPGTAGAGYNQYVELRYSRACDAAWSRVTSRLHPHKILFTRAWVRGHDAETSVKKYGKVQVISKMWPGIDNQACGVSVNRKDPTYRPIGCVGPQQ